MQDIIIPALLILLVALTIRHVPANARVVDGDTLEVHGRRWRLAGIDAPEWDQPGGRAASTALKAHVRTGRLIGLVTGRDAYGRALVIILTPRGPLGWSLAINGLVHGEGLVGTALTLMARIARRGLWADGRAVSPRLWRMAHPSR